MIDVQTICNEAENIQGTENGDSVQQASYMHNENRFAFVHDVWDRQA